MATVRERSDKALRMFQSQSAFQRAVKGDLPPIALLVLLSLLAFSREMLLGMTPMDMDILTQSIPVMTWYSQVTRAGQDFLWTPDILGGFPIAFSQYSLFGPLDWLASRVMDPTRAFALLLALYLPLAGISTYCYGRTAGLSRLPSLLAAVGYQLSTEALAMGINGYGTRSMFLLPTMLLSIELMLRRGSVWALLGAIGVGFSTLTGTPSSPPSHS